MARPPDAPLASRSQSPPLLRLTPGIRQRIYRYLGLASWGGRPHSFNLRGGQASYYTRDPPDPRCFHGLLLSCRAIYTEAAALLYSTNRFVLYFSQPPVDRGNPASPLLHHALRTLTPSSLRSLYNLKIVLNEAACHQLTTDDYTDTCCLQGREDQDWLGLHWCKQKHRGAHQLPLLSPASADTCSDEGNTPRAAQTMLNEWHSAAARLFSHVAPGRLALSLVCDIDPHHPQALVFAKSFVAPIQLLPPSYLRECHIRLAKTPDGRFQQLAQDAVSQACGIPTPSLEPPASATTTLLTLPRELRVRILEYTDLVTPQRQMIWSRQDRAYVVCHCRSEDYHPPEERHSDQFSECWLDKTFDGGSQSNGCFCRRRHAAFSLTCKCWTPPGPALFLVCRTLSEDARFVFFSNNRFIVHDYKLLPPWVLPLLELHEGDHDEDGPPVPAYPYPNERFAVSESLREVVPTPALAHLRFLELVFPPYRAPSWPETQHPAMQDWRATVDWLRDKTNSPGLTLRLTVADVPSDAPGPYRRTITVEEGETVMAAFMDLMHPLKRLAADRGLARFYAHFPYPWKCTEESRSRASNDRYWVWREKIALKERAERYVMGGRYDSLYADGKEEPKPSDWEVMA
ncbi:hypothetical protein C8A01DRAFT_50025 [Parachaetomium inaequale]|uniref:F-box domain-containing protein n=1 Tax=Parachaetomium inaequale TaxID=2588326 RepID=A0AAN6P9P8_9PEZI|nr:hypothetical protein C8A01DRAFT_50025 [Parachaetomium inaequale]